ncbi:MAG: MerC domain-containing protein [Xanthomonadaceae bacterium]|jgi:hypothetical protein|nr:MerC domain-containing protein [Xanthomonadaceae bacterium]
MSSSSRHLLDRFGATGSLLCAVHCALTPLLLAAIPSLGLSLWTHHGLELGLVVFVTCLGLFSLMWGYRRHRMFHPLLILVLGLATLWAGITVHALHASTIPHAITMTIGGVLVAAAHMINLRLNHAHARVHDERCAH